jgi:hypothetical protein
MPNNLEVTVAAYKSHRNPKSVNNSAALMCHTWTAGHHSITPSVCNRKLDLDMAVHSLRVQFREKWYRKWHADDRHVYTTRLHALELQHDDWVKFLGRQPLYVTVKNTKYMSPRIWRIGVSKTDRRFVGDYASIFTVWADRVCNHLPADKELQSLTLQSSSTCANLKSRIRNTLRTVFK